MRAFEPLPLMRSRSAPSSRAHLRTDGLACARENPASSTAALAGDTVGTDGALAAVEEAAGDAAGAARAAVTGAAAAGAAGAAGVAGAGGGAAGAPGAEAA